MRTRRGGARAELARPKAAERLARFRKAIREAGSIGEVRRQMEVLSRERKHFAPSISEGRIRDVVARWSAHFDAELVQEICQSGRVERWLENPRIPGEVIRGAMDLLAAELEWKVRGVRGGEKYGSSYEVLKGLKALVERNGIEPAGAAYQALVRILEAPGNLAEHRSLVEAVSAMLLSLASLSPELVQRIYRHTAVGTQVSHLALRHPAAPPELYRELAASPTWSQSTVSTLASLPLALQDRSVRRLILGWCAFHDPEPLLRLLPVARGEECREILRILGERAPGLAAAALREMRLEEEVERLREALDAEVLVHLLASREPELRLAALRLTGGGKEQGGFS